MARHLHKIPSSKFSYQKKCTESDLHFDASLGDNVSIVVYRCPMGLVDAASPIFVDGEHLGNVFTGQLFIEPPEEEFFIAQARKYGFNENEYLEAMRKVPIVTEEFLSKNLTFLVKLAQMFGEQGLLHKRQREADAVIQAMAFYDPLTNLPNRRLLQDRLLNSLAASARNQKHVAVMFLDLDNFKSLNDTRGHSVGDIFLVVVANRLQDCVRKCDTVARLGGDEFIIMLEDLSEEFSLAVTHAETVGNKILAAINRPYILEGHVHHGSTSIGISLYSKQGVTVEDLIKHADTAMYEAKNAGRNTLRFYDPTK